MIPEPSDLRTHFDKRAFPSVFSVDQLLAEELPPAKFIVPDLLPEGVTLLAGKPKIGKTWLAQGLAVAIATGGMALGIKPVEQGEVLYLALEDNKRRLHKRFKKLATQHPLQGLSAAIEWPCLGEGGAEMIDNWCATHPDARLVVIDTLKKVRQRTNGQRSVYDVDYEALEPLLPVANANGVAILVLHHQRKMDADDPLDTISGSTGLSGGVDGTLVLKRDRGSADAYLFVDGRDVEEPGEFALRWDAELTSWQLLGDAEEYRIGETRAKILRALLEVAPEPMSPMEIAVEVGESIDNVRHTLRRMDKDGQVKKVGYGKYCHSSHSVLSQNETMTGMTSDSGKQNGARLEW
jgi:AAA domain